MKHYSFTEKLMTVSKEYARVQDICVLKDCARTKGYEYKNQIKKELKEKYIYPIPMSEVIRILHVDEHAIEKAAIREKKFGFTDYAEKRCSNVCKP